MQKICVSEFVVRGMRNWRGVASGCSHQNGCVSRAGLKRDLAESQGGGACGVWVEHDGELAVNMVGQEAVIRKHE